MAELIAEIIGRLIAVLLLLPVCMIVATPFVLVSAPFRRGGVRSGYAAVYRFWGKWLTSIA